MSDPVKSYIYKVSDTSRETAGVVQEYIKSPTILSGTTVKRSAQKRKALKQHFILDKALTKHAVQ